MQKIIFFFFLFGCFLPRPLHSAHSITWKFHSLCWNRPWLCSQSCGCSPVRINTEQGENSFLTGHSSSTAPLRRPCILILSPWSRKLGFKGICPGLDLEARNQRSTGYPQVLWSSFNLQAQIHYPLDPPTISRVGELTDSVHVFFTLEIMTFASEGFSEHSAATVWAYFWPFLITGSGVNNIMLESISGNVTWAVSKIFVAVQN